MPRRRLAILAFGGNALIRPGEDGTQAEQVANARRFARAVVPLIRRRWDLLMVHGNGPQVGNLMIRMEEAVTKVPPLGLDYCVAQSQGEIGYLLQVALTNRLRTVGLHRPVACLLTHARVEPEDPAFDDPTKPVGPFLSRYRAEFLRRERRARVVEDAGRGWRQVVPSPRPVEVLGTESIRALLEAGFLVIAGGGGGIPVVEGGRGGLRGVEAVVDKDFTAGLLARELGAERLVILTDVEQVYVHFGKRNQRGLERVRCWEARRYLSAGHFPPGSMGPKVETAVGFVESTGGEAIITRPERLPAALSGRAGTRFLPDPPARAGRRGTRGGR